MKEFSKEDYKMYLKEYKERGASCFKRSRNKSLGKEATRKAYREHLDCQAMIRNMNHKMKHGQWLYDDRPDGSFSKYFRVLASGDPDKVGKVIDSFGREYNVPRETD